MEQEKQDEMFGLRKSRKKKKVKNTIKVCACLSY